MHRIFTTSVASVHVHYVAKAERKGRFRAEVDEVIRWLTGFCGVRVQDVEDPLMRQIRCLDKLVDELAKGKAMERIKRT